MAASSEARVSSDAEQPKPATNLRSKVTVGPLPDDFLRLDGGQPPQPGQEVSPHHRPMRVVQQMGFSHPQIAGKLVLSVVQAKLIKSYSMMFKMDPYCRIRLGHQVFETPTAHAGGKEPRWNRTIQCYLPVGCDRIDIEIFDEKSFGEDERVAWTRVEIPAAVFEGKTVDDWFPLSGRSGENGSEGSVQLTFTLYTAARAPQPRMYAHPGYAGSPGYPMPGVYYQPSMAVPASGSPPVQTQMYTDDDLKQVKEMFPEMDGEVIQSVLEAQGGNVQAAINALLEMNN